MKLDRLIRLLLGVLILLVLVLTAAATLFVTESALNVWDRLREGPRWLYLVYGTGVIAVALGAGWVVWRLLWPRRELEPAEPEPPVSEDDLETRIEAAEAVGVDVAAARRELGELTRRREAGLVQVAVFGEISSGKSSLIRALLPDARVIVSARGGSTRDLERYEWHSPAGDRLVLVDMPGMDEADGELDASAREEALRAHVVIYVCDGDLTRRQNDELRQLTDLGKPVLLALNKSDRYTGDELEQVRERLGERLAGIGDVDLVAISAGGVEEAVRVHPDGREETVTRRRQPDVVPLQMALQRRLDEDPNALEVLRDATLFHLAARKLDEATAAFRRERAAELVASYTRKAIVGALAAVAPGTDLVIQGYLGTSLVKALCRLYEAPVRDLDVERFLRLVERHVGKALPLLLAVAGNALKAFPGLGTVAGGLMHAVAYGIIFDALGRSVAQTLEVRGELPIAPAAQLFKEKLGDNLDARTERVVRLALARHDDAGAERDAD